MMSSITRGLVGSIRPEITEAAAAATARLRKSGAGEQQQQQRAPVCGAPTPAPVQYRGLPALDENPPAMQVAGPSGRVYGPTRSFCCLLPSHFPRKLCIQLIESRSFEPFIMFIIILNVILMASESKLDPPDTFKSYLLDQSEGIFLFIYTLEMVMKMVAYGVFMHEGSYLRDSWCQLDFLVVSLAWLPKLTAACQLFGHSGVPRLASITGAQISARNALIRAVNLESTKACRCRYAMRLCSDYIRYRRYRLKGTLHYGCVPKEEAEQRMMQKPWRC